MERKKVLECRDLHKKFGKKEILKGISLEASEGDILGFIGPNGAGKTTTIKLILGLQSITSGNVMINGYDVQKDFTNAIKRVGTIVENPDLYMYMSGYDNLKMISNLYSGVTKERIDEVIKLVGLENRIKDKVSKYSLGMRQRLGIAQAMLNNPKILILDEPTAGLDPKERVKFRNLISSFSQDKIVILSTHIVSDIEFIADEIIVMKAGKKILTGTPEELLQDLRGSVWKCVAYDKKEVEMLNHKYCIINIHKENNTTELRIVSRQKPTVNAVNIEPNLEDLYLAYFQDNEK